MKINVTKCPKCGGTTVYEAAFDKAGLDDPITCPKCSGRSPKRDFLRPAVDEFRKGLTDALRNIPGFKPVK